MKKVINFITNYLAFILVSISFSKLNAQSFTANIVDFYDDPNHCAGYMVFFIAEPSDNSLYTYSWTCPGGICPPSWDTSSFGAAFMPTNDSLGVGIYSVLITEIATGISSLDTIYISTHPIPSVALSGVSSGCEGSTSVIKAHDYTNGVNQYGPYTYSWSGGSSTISDSLIYTFGANSQFIENVAITNSFGCTGTTYSFYWMYGSPTPAANITAGGPTTFCTGDSVRLVGEGTHNFYSLQNITYQWRKYQNNVNDIDSVYYAKGIGRYRCIIAASGCADTSNYIDVVTNPLPVVTVNPNGQVGYCFGQSVTLAATSPTAISYKWKRYASLMNSQTNDSLTVSIGGKYKAVVEDANGCSRTSPPVEVFGPPNNQVTASGPLSFCTGDSVIFTAAPGYTYQWKMNNINIPAPEGTSQSYTAKAAGKYKVLVTNNFNCTVASAVKQVLVPCRLANPEVGELDWEVFPNPFHDYLRIRIPYLLESTCMVALYDLSGRLVLESEIMATDDTEIELFTGDLQNGMYLLQIRTGEEIIKHVVVKQ